MSKYNKHSMTHEASPMDRLSAYLRTAVEVTPRIVLVLAVIGLFVVLRMAIRTLFRV